jgi:hypothetical protein
MSMVIAHREDSLRTYVGFQADTEFLGCDQCKIEYRLRYTKDHEKELPQHRLAALRAIANEHPRHEDQIRIA